MHIGLSSFKLTQERSRPTACGDTEGDAMSAQLLDRGRAAGGVQTKAVPDDVRALIEAALVAGRVTKCPPGHARGSLRSSYDELVKR